MAGRSRWDEGSYVLQAAEALGIEIPTLCFFKYVKPYAACRICVVEAKNKRGRHAESSRRCNYPASEGIEIPDPHPASHRPRGSSTSKC